MNISPLWDILLFVVAWSHVLLSPFTKVEESFSLHATHDVLMYGISPYAQLNYDHKISPGPVPRTFIGSVLLAWLSTPVFSFLARMGVLNSKYIMQVTVRLVLATVNCVGLCLIRHGVSRRWGSLTGVLYTLITCSQFHLPFWMGRTLPNMFALLPVNIAIYSLIPPYPRLNKPTRQGTYRSIAILTATAVIFRAEIALLIIPITIQALLSRAVKLNTLIIYTVVSALGSIGLTVLIDSYFWAKTPLWPELSSLHYNVILGKSSEWGVSPPLAYFTTHIPKLLLTALPLGLLGWSVSSTVGGLVTPFVMFVAAMSYLKHKEWRFVVYLVPVMNIAAAVGMKWLLTRRLSSAFYKLLLGAIAVGLILTNVVATVSFTLASRANYPGGDALGFFHEIYRWGQVDPLPHVHISNLAAQSGASLFLHSYSPPYPIYPSFSHFSQFNATHRYFPIFNPNARVNLTSLNKTNDSSSSSDNKPKITIKPKPKDKTPLWYWQYNKTEGLSLADLSSPDNAHFTHLISEFDPASAAASGADTDSDIDIAGTWSPVAVISSFERWEVNWEWWMFKKMGISSSARSARVSSDQAQAPEPEPEPRDGDTGNAEKDADVSTENKHSAGKPPRPSDQWPLRMVLKNRLWILDRKVKVKG